MFRLDEVSLDWALSHIKRHGDTDIFPVPFEYQALDSHWQDIKNYLLAQDLDEDSKRLVDELNL